MKLKTSVSLMVALVLGLVTAKVGLDLLKRNQPAGTASARVVVAKKDMEPGYVIEATDIESQEVAANLVPAKAIKSINDVIGRTVTANLPTGQTILETLVAPKGAGAGLQAMVPPGMRAVTLDMSDSGAVAGMLSPGCRVDVIAALRKGDTTIAKTIVENVKIQNVGRTRTGYSSKTGPIDNGPVKSVTLLVTPRQAAAIELANNAGSRPRLVLRGTGDETASDSEMSARQLLGESEPEPVTPTAAAPKEDAFSNPAPGPEASKGREVEIIRAGQSTKITYDDQNGGATPASNKSQEEGSGATPTAKKPAGDQSRTASDKSSETSTRTDARQVIH